MSEKLHRRLEFPEKLFMDRYLHENREKSKELFRKRYELNQELDSLEFETQRLIKRQSNGINMRVPDALSTVIGLASDLTNQTADLPESESANQEFPGNLSRNQMEDIVNLLTPWLRTGFQLDLILIGN